MYEYKAIVNRVIDGDTIVCEISLGFNISITEHIRLAGIDTAEIFRPKNDIERKHGYEAKVFVEELVLNKQVILRSSKHGKYRWVGDIIFSDNMTLSEKLFEAGFAKKDEYLIT